VSVPRAALIDWLRGKGFHHFDSNKTHDLYKNLKVIVSMRNRPMLSEEHAKDVVTKSGATTQERDQFIESVNKGANPKKT